MKSMYENQRKTQGMLSMFLKKPAKSTCGMTDVGTRKMAMERVGAAQLSTMPHACAAIVASIWRG